MKHFQFNIFNNMKYINSASSNSEIEWKKNKNILTSCKFHTKDLYVFLAFASCLESIVLKLFSCTQLCCYCKCPTSLFEFSTFCTPVKILANNNKSWTEGRYTCLHFSPHDESRCFFLSPTHQKENCSSLSFLCPF